MSRKRMRGTGVPRSQQEILLSVENKVSATLGSGLSQLNPLPFRPDALALELAAGGGDVAAARGADRGAQPAVVDDLGEAVDAVVGAALVGRTRPGIERDQVHLGVDRRQDAHQL